MALVGVLPLVQRGEKGVEHSVIALENLIQENNVRLRDLAGGVYLRTAGMQLPQCVLVYREAFCQLTDSLLRPCTLVFMKLLHQPQQFRQF